MNLEEILRKSELKENIELAKAGKYVKRTGSPGSYKYWYKDSKGKLVTGKVHRDAPEREVQATYDKKSLGELQEIKKEDYHKLNPVGKKAVDNAIKKKSEKEKDSKTIQATREAVDRTRRAHQRVLDAERKRKEAK